jgi:hypothetical protein
VVLHHGRLLQVVLRVRGIDACDLAAVGVRPALDSSPIAHARAHTHTL